MKTFRKSVAVILVALMLLTSAPLSGFVGLEIKLPEWPTFEAKAASSEYLTSGFCGEVTETTDGTQISWVLSDEGVLTITGEGRMEPKAFNYDLRIKEIVIGDGITNISDYCFSSCSNLVKVTMGEDVETIGDRAFYYCTGLTEIVFSDSVETVGSHAFYNCSALKSISFSDSLKLIEDWAFGYCYALKSIDYLGSLKSMERAAFYNCTALKRVKLPETLITIGSIAFGNCPALSNVEFSESLETIEVSAFENCTSLLSVELPDSLITLQVSAFLNCSKLETVTIGSGLINIETSSFASCNNLRLITVSEENPNFSSFNGVLYNKLKTELVMVPGAIEGEISIPNSVEKLTRNSFANCGKITAINIQEDNENYKSVDGIVYTSDGKTLIVCPKGKTGIVTIAEGVETIGDSAFYYCTGITEIVFSNSVETVGSHAFYNCTALKSVSFSDSLKLIKDWAFGYCYALQSIDYLGSLETIERAAFYDCSALKCVVLPDTLITIGSIVFQDCVNLSSVDFSESIKTIEVSAFENCKSLLSVTLPDSLTTLQISAFLNCSKLETVTVGSGLVYIGTSSFSSCNNLRSITVSEENPNFSSFDGILYNKQKTELIMVPGAIEGEISIPNSVEKLTRNSFANCGKITAINIQEDNENYKSVDGIVYTSDGKTLIVCPKGKTGAITIAEGVEVIDDSAFYYCTGITEIVFSDSVETVGSHAFYNCTALKSVSFSDSLKLIKDWAFGYCYALQSIDYLGSLETIERAAFYDCSALKCVVLPDTLITIGSIAFMYCSELQTINFPKKISKIYNEEFKYCGFTEIVIPETFQSFDNQGWINLKKITIENKYWIYTGGVPSFPKNCTIRAYCGSTGHKLAVKRLYNFESIGHTCLDWYVAQPATYDADGIERRDCAYCDGYEERIIPKLESNVFTATFVANGEIVATVDFPKGTTEITEPAVPAKNRYIGEWEEYTLADTDITINAVYTLIKSEDASEIETESEAIHYTDKDDVLFRFKAWADATVVKSTISKSVPLDIVLVVDQSGSMDETLGGRTKKVDALKETAKDFVNTVYENAKMTDADHRISLVGFGLSGNYQGFEKNENTELLTSANGIVKFDDIKTTDYASSLLSVNVDGAVNSALITAIDSIGARGATAADLGFEMAKGVFANTDSEGRQRVVIFMTDGEPTYLSGFQTSVANSAIANASVLKKNFGASIYSVGVFSDSDSRNTNIKKFMNAVSSGYPNAVSMNYMGQGVDGQYYLTVNNTDLLTSVFKSISTESLSHTAPFDNLTVIKTLSEYVTMTSRQEERLRIDLIRKYGITNDDIIITRNADGTTAIQINGLTPYETTKDGEVIYEVSVEFFASLNEKAATAGDYIVDTEDSGVMLGEDAKGYEATFDTSTITLDAEKTRVIFTINGEVYEVSENISNGYAVAPEFEISEDWQFSGWDTKSNKATNGLVIDATLKKAERTITWHTAEGDIVQTYFEGDFIKAPVVEFNAYGDTFLSWDKSIPTIMPDKNLEFTAVYGGHVHKYTSEVTKEMTCTADGTRTFTCSCGDTYDEVITAIGHNYEAITPSLEKDDAKCTFCCTNCGDKYEYALDYVVVQSTGKKDRVLYEFQLTDDNLNTEMQPDGAIQIRIPLSKLHGSAEHVTVIRTNDDGSKTQVPAVHEKGFLIITCDHFTPYEVIFDIPYEGHIQGEWVIEKEPTCSEEGLKYAVCTECEKRVFEESIDKLSHTESEWIIDEDATCSKEGAKHTICTVCKEPMKTATIQKKSHTESGWIINKDSTCTAEGAKHKVCTVCGKTVKTESIAKLDHSYNAVVTEATCEKGGYTTYTCVCGDTYTGNQTPATGHNYSDGVCTECGEKKDVDCSCNCHKGGFSGLIWKILCFFYKLFGMNKTCGCGVAHY